MTDRPPASGSPDPGDTEPVPEEEPQAPGTLFLVMIILMIIIAVWVIMYLRLLER
ncbi:MAG: cytochrome c oxidase subunit 2A [Gemmatimonadetes bacterium]|nr:cytochrome c oxidase subunit 2A [Gemmatimonadota bacterium]